MKFGCCTSMVSTQKDGTGIEYIKTLKAAGYDYIELPLTQMMALTEEEFTLLKEQVQTSGIMCEACNNFFPAGIKITGNEVNPEKIDQYLQAAFGRALQLGVKVIVFGSSGARNVPSGFPMEKAREQFVEVLRRVNEIAEPHGIVIVVEPLNKSESNIINTVSEGFQLVKEVDRNNIKLLVDYYHMSKEFEDPRIMTEMGGAIQHIHFAKPEGRVFPNEADAEDYKTFFDCLHGMNYTGRVSIEALTDNFPMNVVKSLELLKKQ